jgi:hypothetical protein
MGMGMNLKFAEGMTGEKLPALTADMHDDRTRRCG